MSYQKEAFTMERAMAEAEGFPYVLAHRMSEVILAKTSDITFDWTELLEARFFSGEAELHLFRCERVWKAVRISDAPGTGAEESMTRSYQLENRYRSLGSALVVKDYLGADEDGQVYVELSRLCGIE